MASSTLQACLLLLLVTLSWAQDVYFPIQCRSYCDPHIDPFPGGRPDVLNPGVQVPGTFVLAVLGSVTVYEHHFDCGGGTYCNDKAAITAYGYTIVIEFDAVTINGVLTPIAGGLTVSPQIFIARYATGQYEVKIDSYTTISTIAPKNFMNIHILVFEPPLPSGGLCTEFVGPNAPEDYKEDLDGFIESWSVHDDTDPFPEPTHSPNPTQAPTQSPTRPPENLEEIARELCAKLLDPEFAERCGIDVSAFYEACIRDVIATGNTAFAGSVIDAYAEKCSYTPEGDSIDLPTSGSGTVATGEGLSPSVNVGTHSFTIQARDIRRRDKTVGGDRFVVSSTPPLAFEVSDIGKGRYSVTYTVREAGVYSISVWFRGHDPIANSPYRVVAGKPRN